MCGIFGMLSRKEKPFNKRAFCTMGVRNDSRGGDSCGVFIDGNVEYGVDKEKFFINFFRNSVLLDATTQCKVALGHCRKASVGKVSVETAQPVVLQNEAGEVEFVLIHNGTIYNYKELAQKYIPDVNIEGLTDSQVMARIFYYAGYDALDEYIGGAVFVIHDYRVDKSYVFKGCSKKYTYSAKAEEERPLYFCWHNGRFCFSSIFETLYAFYYEEKVYDFPVNRLMVVRSDKLKLVKEYKRDKVTQSKPAVVTTAASTRVLNDDDDFFGEHYGGYYTEEYKKSAGFSYKVKHDGVRYIDDKNKPMHGTYYVSQYGYVFPNRKDPDTWLQTVAFFDGKMLKHPDAFKLINGLYLEANQNMTPKVTVAINMLDFNPYSEDKVQFYWYEDETCMIPQDTWKYPMAELSRTFDENGILIAEGKENYYSWATDYHMYTYDEKKLKEAIEKECVGV